MPSALLQISPKLGIDLGHATTRIWLEGKGVVATEASCVAIEQQSGKIVAYGNQAAQLRGRLGEAVVVRQLLLNGELADVELLQQFLQRVLAPVVPFNLLGPVVLVAVPADFSSKQIQLLTNVLETIGAREVSVIAQPLAAAIGAGVPIADATGALVVVAGAGELQAACVALGTQTAWKTSQTAGLAAVTHIAALLKDNHHFLVSDQTAQQLLESVVSVQKAQRSKQVVGKSALSGAPQEFLIKSALLNEAGLQVAQSCAELIKDLLKTMDASLMVDVVAKGIVLTGGLSQLAGLEEYLVRKLGVCVATAEEPELAVIKGTGVVLQHYELFKQGLGYR